MISMLRYLLQRLKKYYPLEWMPAHCKVTSAIKFPGTINTRGWREALRVSGPRPKRRLPGLKPGPLDKESNTLGIMQMRTHESWPYPCIFFYDLFRVSLP